MTRGRKPKPPGLQTVLGNPGKRKLKADVVDPGGEPVCPAYLKDRAAELWDEVAPALIACKVLTQVDAYTFAAWCALQAEFEADPAGMQASRIAQMRALASSCGLDPSSRTRLNIGGNEGEEDPTAGYFTGPRKTA
jgi:phage terminase small subunit